MKESPAFPAAGYLRRYRRCLVREVLLDALAAAGSAACILAVLSLNGLLPRHIGQWAVLLYAAALPVVPLVWWVWPVSLKMILSRLDGYYGLGELLVTAAETQTDEPFGFLVQKRAADALERGVPAEVFTTKLRRRHLLGPVFLILWAVLTLFLSGEVSPAAREARTLADEGERLAARAEEHDLPYTRELARRMEELAERLEEPSISRREALERIETLRRQVLRAMDDLERSYLVDPGDEPAAAFGDTGNTREDETESGETSVRSSGSGGSQEKKSGEDTDSGEKSFSEDGDGEASEPEDRKAEELESLKDAEERLDSARESLEESFGGDTEDRDTASGPDEGGPAESENMPGEPEDEAEGGHQLPGSREEEDIPGDMYRQKEEHTAPGTPLEGEAGDIEGSFGAFMRALPEYSFSVLPEGYEAGEYRYMIEEAITREDIPVELRALVRDYFMSLAASGGSSE